MEFAWSEDKRRQNLAKHGLDFADVALLNWERATILDHQLSPGEQEGSEEIWRVARLRPITVPPMRTFPK